MYQIKPITQKEIWETFVKSQEFTLTTQSWNFGEFHAKRGEKRGDEFFAYGVFEDDELIGGTLVLGEHAKRGNFMSIPYGPILARNSEEAFSLLMDFIQKQAQEKGYCFIRVSPFVDNTEKNQSLYQNYGFRKAPLHMLAEHTRLLDLSPSEDELLMNMKKNHRNLIRRCERDGVRVEMYTDKDKLKEFHEMIDFTAKRHNFTRFSDNYVETEFEKFNRDEEVTIFHAYLPDGTLDSAAVVFYYGKMAAYRHGTSLIQNTKLPTSYALQWTAIQEAKKRGMRYYNFWGIAPDDAPKSHPFKGITHFKKGFGGETKELLPAQDYVVSNKYWFNWIIEEVRRRKRGF